MTSLPQSKTIAMDSLHIATAIATFLLAYSIIAHTRKPDELNVLLGFILKATPTPLKPLAASITKLLFGHTSNQPTAPE